MKKKTKTQKTNLPSSAKPMQVPETRILGSILDGNYVLETPCERIRRLATEENERAKAIVRQSQREFVQRICGDIPFTEDQGVFTICGYKWVVCGTITHYLTCVSDYKGIDLDTHDGVNKPSELGRILLRLDNRLNELKAKYPDTFWGNLKRWFDGQTDSNIPEYKWL